LTCIFHKYRGENSGKEHLSKSLLIPSYVLPSTKTIIFQGSNKTKKEYLDSPGVANLGKVNMWETSGK
jgi:hypothetical protein